MADLLKQLLADHANFARAIHALAHQAELTRTGQRPDFQVVNGIVAYFRDYAQRVHHPKEDLLYNTLKDRAPTNTRGIYDLLATHAGLPARLEEVEGAAAVLERDSRASGQDFRHKVHDFAAYELAHMKQEEAEFLPYALKWLRPEDWAWVDSPFKDTQDPIFGDQLTAPLQGLLRTILASDPAVRSDHGRGAS